MSPRENQRDEGRPFRNSGTKTRDDEAFPGLCVRAKQSFFEYTEKRGCDPVYDGTGMSPGNWACKK